MDYYKTTIALAIGILIVLMTIVLSNDNFDKRTRKGFVITFTLIIIGTISNLIGVVIDGKMSNNSIGIYIHIIAKWLELTIVPIIPIIYSKNVFEMRRKNKNGKNILIKLCYLCIIIDEALISTNKIFIIDNNNIYHQVSAVYNWYIATVVVSMLYLFWNALKFSNEYQNDKNFELYSIIVFVVFCMFVQMTNQSVKICWITVAILATFIYIYYNGIIQNIDGMTKLLNQHSYQRTLERADETHFALVIFDANDFKKINDQLGHDTGDEVLKNISNTIKEHYEKYGKCYRIGGDEFAVIMTKDVKDIEEICKKFVKKVSSTREKYNNLPYVSYGYSIYYPNNKLEHSIKDTIKEADKMMYRYKKKSKKQQEQQEEQQEQQM
jgi:hypothetical protein